MFAGRGVYRPTCAKQLLHGSVQLHHHVKGYYLNQWRREDADHDKDLRYYPQCRDGTCRDCRRVSRGAVRRYRCG